MKFAPLAAALAVLVAPAAGVQVVRANSNARAPGTIKTVVTALQTMLDDSKKEGDTETDLYTKFKSYCDDNEKEKTESVESLTKQIGLLENEIQDVQANNGGLSMDVAGLKKDMATNEEARNMAEGMRKKEKEAFDADEADLVAAIDQMKQAVNLLADIGADQSLAASAAHSKFMAGKAGSAAFLKLQTSISKALVAANSFLTPSQHGVVESFLQATEPSGSAGILAVLKAMQETFDSNLVEAKNTEAAAVKANEAYIKTKKEEFDMLKTSFDEKEATMGTNDGEISTKKTQLGDAIQQKADDEDFLAKLEEMCGDKGKDYGTRVELRAGEEAALSKAIAILNSDHAFGAFDKVAATKTGATGAFVQLASATQSSGLGQARRYLQKLAAENKSVRLARIAGLLSLGNPFDGVFKAIDDMKATIEEEAQQDAEQKTWCEDETKTSSESLDEKKSQITELKNTISTLDTTINDPETGLIKMIADDEAKLEQNAQAQKDETEARRLENEDYQKNVANCDEAEVILGKAIKAMNAYYKEKDAEIKEELGGSLLQRRQEPAPPSTWEGDFSGQSEGGNLVIGMLEFILTETEKEEEAAHTTESEAVAAYETSMTALKTEEEDTMNTMANKKKELTEARLSFEEKNEDLEKTEQEKATIETYLERIKPGCDFITSSLDGRKASRAEEKQALETAVTFLKQTPVYRDALEAAHQEGLGKCKEICAENDLHVNCKSCLARISVPGYCAGHASAEGC
mmetsp:Transcript_55989/g.150763  ORF Transcript_55989/g.150763 Transcript_55989/m.150763 type:complete len:748 (-) Transcript_55989:84-2327(-)